jgi:dipeptidyl aminopeptidase/acylaminoacyl peptidase
MSSPLVQLGTRTAIIVAVGAACLSGQSVSVSAGNLVYHAAAGAQTQVTNSGRDSMPSLSSDGRLIAFVRRAPGDTVNTAVGWEERTELWIVHADASNARRLLRGREGSRPQATLAHFESPVFSLDARTVYVSSRGWVTSDALHAVDVGTGRERFVCAANGFELLAIGRYRGDLMVGQHRHGPSGAYDRNWIVSPSGQVVRLVALDGAPDADALIAAARAGTLR